MKFKWFGLAVFLVLLAVQARGETVHLSSGEVLKGRIVSIEEDVISIESDSGFGVIQIQKSDVILIEYDSAKRDPSKKVGIGYFHRVNPNSTGGEAMEFAVDALSLKFWANSLTSLDFLVGFFNANLGNNRQFEVFSFDVRLAHVFKRQSRLDLYWGGSVGFISVKDNTGSNDIDGTGLNLRVFFGTEIFLPTLPNLGISAEVGFGTQEVDNRKVTNLSTTTFPALSMRYYF
ncbi:MAG: hypothetical protein O7A08_04335 [SAR324 cluster bacterium]|nr:hypothetical protein [SAR324 cluster bacterium]MCZ6532174.1 hypothetical protein [SAR324 cluster bacterium]MCZ6556205.1 hypothetical protein [SAR324 cluster bacterium]MCZ6627138.1 hypothetical protein [SAR324 cluster bacterium]MCZ6646703.1 hypothetical protein [SAR324 cluster bacterium]